MIEHLIIAVTTSIQIFILIFSAFMIWEGSSPTLRHGGKWLLCWCIEMSLILLNTIFSVIGAEVVKQWLLSLLQ